MLDHGPGVDDRALAYPGIGVDHRAGHDHGAPSQGRRQRHGRPRMDDREHFDPDPCHGARHPSPHFVVPDAEDDPHPAVGRSARKPGPRPVDRMAEDQAPGWHAVVDEAGEALAAGREQEVRNHLSVPSGPVDIQFPHGASFMATSPRRP